MRYGPLLLLHLSLVHGVAAVGADDVEVAVLTDANWAEFAPLGKEVDAIVGDIVLRNQYVTAVIAQPIATRHANMTVRDVGGCLIDLTTRDQSSDQLHCYYPGRRQQPFRDWQVVVDGKPTISLTPDLNHRGKSIAVIVHAAGTDDLPERWVAYSLTSASRALGVSDEYVNMSSKELSTTLVNDLRLDGGKEDQVRAPNGTGQRFWYADRFWQQAYIFEVTDAGQWEFNSDARTANLTFLHPAGESGKLVQKPGARDAVSYRIAPGRSLLHSEAALGAEAAGPVTEVTYLIRDSRDRPVVGAVLELTRNGQYAGTITTGDNGAATAAVVPGEYGVQVKFNGAAIESHTLNVRAGDPAQRLVTQIKDFTCGEVTASITDGDGRPIAAKVDFRAQGDVPQPNFGPETAEFGVKNLRYAPDGTFTQSLHPGTYDVIVSHGPEYDAVFTTVTIKPGESTALTAKLDRSVNTAGWISSDFHSHSTPSGDNTSSQLGRVINLLCEHLEFAPCTEHNRITTYQEHIDRLKIADRLASCVGMELTGKPLPLNHQNAFPLHHHHHRQDGGGPVTDDDVRTQIERLALWDDRSEKLIQQNHPDIGWLFFDKNGDGQPDGGHAGAFGFMDVIEIHPIDRAWSLRTAPQQAKDWNHRVFHWLQLLNQGYRIPGVVNTDAHYNHHGSGGLRNWLESPTDNPGEVQILDMVHAAEHGHLVMSNGPFLKVYATTSQGEGDTAGGDLTAPDGRVTLDIQVQAPNWIDVDEAFVLINGRLDPAHHFRRGSHASLFPDGAVKFETRLKLELKSDSHLIVVAGAPDKQLGPVQGPSWGDQKPTAISNPIYIDVDGNGFAPNKDTLGHRLPVKDGTPE